MNLFSYDSTQPAAISVDKQERIALAAFGHLSHIQLLTDTDALDKICLLEPNEVAYLISNGGVSNYQLLEALIGICAPCEVYFTTWAISEVVLGKLHEAQQNGSITQLAAVLDVGNRNRKEKVFDLFKAVIPQHAFKHCHAKVCTVIGNGSFFTVVGSANMTKNPRKEAAIIANNKQLAEVNKAWILDELN